MMRKIFLLAAAAVPAVMMASTPLWMRDVAISPDGRSIAFAYKGDIWKVPSSGGQAVRLTTNSAYDEQPVWSPDSKSIAFASDRHGNSDVFVMPASGGQARRLTFNSANETPVSFTPDGKSVLFSAVIQDPVRSATFPSPRMSELYQVPVGGGAMTQVLATPVPAMSFLPDGKRFVYQDVKGFEDNWRKHHTSSVTRDIWLYDPATGKHTNLTSRGGEDLNPVAAGDRFYFLSERNGATINVYSAPIANPADAKAVTSFKTHPVRFLSRAEDGTLCFTYDGEIYTLVGNGKPSKVAIDIVDDITEEPYKRSVTRADEMEVSPDGKSIAFTSRGDVFVTSVDYKTTKQISSTPATERHLTWGSDSKSLYYASERDGNSTIYKATMGREDDINFPNATIIKEEPVMKADAHERTVPQVSPDGKQMAFILDRNILAVMDLDSKKVRQLTDGSTYHHRNGEFNYVWSPDSKWIALEMIDRRHDPYSDIALLNVADGTLTNITNSGYFDEGPRWVMDGNAILFASERYGMRNHASWGSMEDVMIVFLNQEAYDKFRRNKEDAELAKEAEKAAKEKEDKAKKDDKKDDKKGDKKDDGKKDETKDIKVELDGIDKRMVRLTPFSSDLNSMVMTDDGEKLFFITTAEDNMLWEMDLKEGDVSMTKTLSPGQRQFMTTPDGKTIFIVGSSISKFNPSNSKLTPVTMSATQKIDLAAEREAMFDNMVREEAQRFYVKDMHGVDWPALTKHYRRFLPHINNNEDFSEMLSELLGELNVSHTGSGFRGYSDSQADRTAALGLLYDFEYTGKGLRVAEVLRRGPFGNASTKVHPGVIVEKIGGEEITPDNDYTTLLIDIAGRKTLVSLYDPATGERWDEVVKPISAGAQNSLLYERWVDARAADVDRWSNGRLGYVHISSMDDESFRKVYSDLLGKYNDREGVVVDIRWNGGGRLHEDIEVLLSGHKYLTQEVRGVETCDMPSRRWNKPSIMLMSEACYSNAHGTPWVYKTRGLGKLVGMPVPGTMTSVNWVTMQDPSLYFGIPVVGYRTADGGFLENRQLEPDIKVANDPAVIVTGEDQQLRAAVEALLKEL